MDGTPPVERCETIAEFLAVAGPLLRAREAENHLMLGLCSDMARSSPADIAPALLVVRQQDRVIAAALRTSPRKIILTDGPPAAQHQADLPGVHGPGDTAVQFARHFARLTNRAHEEDSSQRVYECQKVTHPHATAGELRRATAEDIPLLAEWVSGFLQEVSHPYEDPLPLIRRKLARQEVFLWHNGKPVCTASLAGQGSTLARVLLVYTPPAERGRGYATACVAALTQQVHDAGLRALLYTDAANPISNRIYQRIGYKHICNFGNGRFL